MFDPKKQQEDVVANTEIEYAGFWLRVAASVIDTVMLLILLFPLFSFVYGISYWSEPKPGSGVVDVLLNYVVPGMIVILFWLYKSATPGKMILKMRIVDADTQRPAKPGQLLLRYLGYYLSIIPLFSGIIWVGIDKRKQGFHDKLADTVVIKT